MFISSEEGLEELSLFYVFLSIELDAFRYF